MNVTSGLRAAYHLAGTEASTILSQENKEENGEKYNERRKTFNTRFRFMPAAITNGSTCTPMIRSPKPECQSCKYINWYNRSRPDSSLSRKTPDEAYAVMLPTVKLAA